MHTPSETVAPRGWRALGALPVAAVSLVFVNALYIFLVALGNITDYQTNFEFVTHVLSMDTTNFGGDPGKGLDPDVMWRAIDNPVIWNIAYIGLIAWESLTALVLIAGVVQFVRGFSGRGRGSGTGLGFASGRTLATIGLTMLILLFAGGFIAVGGEWFQMWRSTAWNGLEPAFRNSVLAGIALVLLHLPSPAWRTDQRSE